MNLLLKYVHHPFFKIIPLDAGYRAIVFHTQQQPAPLKVGHSGHFFRELFRTYVIALELDT